MEKVLIVSRAETAEKLDELFDKNKYTVSLESGGEAAKRRLATADYGIVLICPPIDGKDGAELAKNISASTSSAVLLLCGKDKQAALDEKLSRYGVFVLAGNASRQVFIETLRLLGTVSARLSLQYKDKLALQGRLEELKLLDRAKCVLIQYLNMTEKEAHRFIEKQAMDRRVSKREIIENILKTYES